MLGITDLKVGAIFKMDNVPYLVIASEHTKLGRGGAIMRTKIKNLFTGAVISRTFKGSEQFPEVDLERVKAQYLYHDDEHYYFMNKETYDQFDLGKDIVGKTADFLKDGQDVEVMIFEDKPINVEVPIKVNYKVTYTEPGFKGNSQSTVLKPAKIETGAEIQVPLFINIGDIIIVDTRTGSYVERA